MGTTSVLLDSMLESVAQPQGVGGSMQEESLDGPSVEEQKTQRSLRESEVRGSKTNRPGGCGLKVDDIGCEHGEK